MSECKNQGAAAGGCEHCTCHNPAEPKPGKVPWLMLALVFMLGFAVLFAQFFGNSNPTSGSSLFDKTGVSTTENLP